MFVTDTFISIAAPRFAPNLTIRWSPHKRPPAYSLVSTTDVDGNAYPKQGMLAQYLPFLSAAC
jgi:hypothetical protein